ncbi:hypothetical protein [Rhizobium sp. BK251]|uniref:hypothetical protein n=1 Tax=Rhizobium sp. BK251 TaxID=2512125 RepID=UPI001044E7F9|nr:hypothetical protein [Rhizobium sp. BK251]TCL73941.1 hypothetical protein EV286_103475 [Rhizobium sp. BK251]
MRRKRDEHRNDEFSTAFPLTVIGGAMLLIVVYLGVAASLIDPPKQQVRVFVPTAPEAIVASR